MVTTSFIHNNL